jgi:hypothetical protein
MKGTNMSNVIEFKPKPKADPYYGVCPHCHSNDGHLNIGDAKWFICHRHQVKWPNGSDLSSDCEHETVEDWTRNLYRLEKYMTVEPVLPADAFIEFLP